MISKGLDAWSVGIGDKMMNSANFNNTPTDNLIFSILTFTYDPFKDPWVLETRNTTAMVYMILVFIFMFAGAAYVYLHIASPTVARNIEWLTGGNLKYFHLHNYLKNLVMSIIFVACVYTGYWLLLLFSELLSELIVSYTLDSIVPVPENIIMYLMMAFATLVLSISQACMEGAFISRYFTKSYRHRI